MSPDQLEMLANLRRAAETGLQRAQDLPGGEMIDTLQHIVDDAKRLEQAVDRTCTECNGTGVDKLNYMATTLMRCVVCDGRGKL